MSRTSHYDDQEPIIPSDFRRSEESSSLLSLCCGPCLRWYSRTTHQKLAQSLQLSENDEDWGLGRDASGTVQLTPKRMKELQAPVDVHSVTVTTDDGRHSTPRTKSRRTQSANPQSHSSTASASEVAKNFHDTDVLLAVARQDHDDDAPHTLAPTLRPSFNSPSSASKEAGRDSERVSDDLDDYMSSTHQSYHGLSSYFRSDNDSNDELDEIAISNS